MLLLNVGTPIAAKREVLIRFIGQNNRATRIRTDKMLKFFYSETLMTMYGMVK